MNYDILNQVEGFVSNVGMSVRPEFYSGRDAMVCDLNKTQLEGIYQQILKKLGDEPSKAFLNMVKDIKILTATKFLNSLYSLCQDDWIWTPELEGSNISINSVFGALFSATSSIGLDETDYIKYKFLLNHGIDLEKEERKMYRYNNLYESRFVDEPFKEVVDGKMSEFDDIEFITEVKNIAINKGYKIENIEKFVSDNEGWWGVYGTYCTPSSVIRGYEETMEK